MKPFFLTTATALAAVLSVPAMAQDHADHADHAAMPAAAPPEEVDHATMDHSHGLLPAIEAPAPDHSAMGHAMAEGPVEASGTAWRMAPPGASIPTRPARAVTTSFTSSR